MLGLRPVTPESLTAWAEGKMAAMVFTSASPPRSTTLAARGLSSRMPFRCSCS